MHSTHQAAGKTRRRKQMEPQRLEVELERLHSSMLRICINGLDTQVQSGAEGSGEHRGFYVAETHVSAGPRHVDDADETA